MPPEKLRLPLAAAYASLFSEAELLELIAFFGSPVGQKLESVRMELADAMYPLISAAHREHLAEMIKAPMPTDETDSQKL